MPPFDPAGNPVPEGESWAELPGQNSVSAKPTPLTQPAATPPSYEPNDSGQLSEEFLHRLRTGLDGADTMIPSSPDVWPPIASVPSQGSSYIAPDYNTSGTEGFTPQEIQRLKWHWGAFFLAPIWAAFHKLEGWTFSILVLFLLRVFVFAHQSLAVTIGVTSLGMQIYLGLNGHKLAWTKRRYPGGLSEYFQVERAWMIGGFCTAGLVFLIFLVLFGTAVLNIMRVFQSK
jgi:hypothetical protein